MQRLNCSTRALQDRATTQVVLCVCKENKSETLLHIVHYDKIHWINKFSNWFLMSFCLNKLELTEFSLSLLLFLSLCLSRLLAPSLSISFAHTHTVSITVSLSLTHLFTRSLFSPPLCITTSLSLFSPLSSRSHTLSFPPYCQYLCLPHSLSLSFSMWSTQTSFCDRPVDRDQHNTSFPTSWSYSRCLPVNSLAHMRADTYFS